MIQDEIEKTIFRELTGIEAEKLLRDNIISFCKEHSDIRYHDFRNARRFIPIKHRKLYLNHIKFWQDKLPWFINRVLFLVIFVIGVFLLTSVLLPTISWKSQLIFVTYGLGFIIISLLIFEQTKDIPAAQKIREKLKKRDSG